MLLAQTLEAIEAPAYSVAMLSSASGREQDAAGTLLQLPGHQLQRQLPALLSIPAGQAPPSPLPLSLELS